jgi:uncharacterized RDD family membrane protein YckC
MRCPKCSYISFDSQDRCRNCGYDLTMVTAEPADLVIAPPSHDERDVAADLDLTSAPEPPVPPRVAATEAGPSGRDASVDLPLFDEEGTGALPPLPPPSARGAPSRRIVDVRGAETPVHAAPGRENPARGLLEADVDFDTLPESGDADAPSMPIISRPPPAARVEPAPVYTHEPDTQASDAAPLAPRVVAGCIDALVLLAIDLTVVWLTLAATGLRWSELRLLPLAPLVSFLALLDVAYLVTFTAASGRTIGKTFVGLRVVGEETGYVPLGHAVVRAVVCLLSALPAGLGFLPIFLDPERRAWHDRLAGTRVVAD